MPQEGVPKGEIRGPFVIQSNSYPGTQHTYWVYVPAQYDPAVPASLMVFQDGQAFKDENGDLRTQNVMDNLIYRREIPVMIGVFINPGRTPEQPEPTPKDWGDRTTNRPAEYNELNDNYAKLIVNELLPAVEKDSTFPRTPTPAPSVILRPFERRHLSRTLTWTNGLDTVTGSDAERLYTRLGWQRCGVIPGYALLPQGGLCATTYFYRVLDARAGVDGDR
jgi:hypothetical protein